MRPFRPADLVVASCLLAACAAEGPADLSGTWLFVETTTIASGDCVDEIGHLALHWLVLEHEPGTEAVEGRRLHEPGDALLSGLFIDGRAVLRVEHAEMDAGVESVSYNVVYDGEIDRLEGRADWLRRDEEGEILCRNFTAEVTGRR